MGKKWDDRRNGEKLLHLFTLLMYRNKSWPLKELAVQLNCSKPTVLRLIDQLNSSLYATVSQQKIGRESHYTLISSKTPPSLELNSEGLRQLTVCRDFIIHLLPDESQKAMNVAIAQASSLADDQGEATLTFPTHNLLKGRIDYSTFQTRYHTMTEAIRKNKVVSLLYKSSLQSEPKKLDFAPKILSLYHESLRFLGWIVNDKNQALYDKPTTLLLHRIESANITQRSASKLPDPQNLVEGHFGLINGDPFDVTIRFSPEASLYVFERRWSSNQTTKLDKNGSLLLTMTCKSEVEILQWILSFGKQAEVLSPSWLRETIKAEAMSLLNIYNAP